MGKFKLHGLNFMYAMEYILGRRHFLRCIGKSIKMLMERSG